MKACGDTMDERDENRVPLKLEDMARCISIISHRPSDFHGFKEAVDTTYNNSQP